MIGFLIVCLVAVVLIGLTILKVRSSGDYPHENGDGET